MRLTNFQTHQTAVCISNTFPDREFRASFLTLHQEKHPTRLVYFPKHFDTKKHKQLPNNQSKKSWLVVTYEKKKLCFRLFILLFVMKHGGKKTLWS